MTKEGKSINICGKGDFFGANTMMNQGYDQENNPDASADVLLKCRRGRRRKNPKYNLNQGERAWTPIHFPPGFEGVNGNQTCQVNPINNANDLMVGQAVYGVVEAVFDAGYLLTVKVSNSDTTLRGVVLKPGHYVPVSAENDVAPNVQMIRRNEIPLSRVRNEQHVNAHRNGTAHPVNEPRAVANQLPRAQASNLRGFKSKHVQSVTTEFASPLMSKGQVVPNVLQPASLSNGKVASQQSSQPSHLVASKGEQVSEAANSSNVEKSTNQMPIVCKLIFPIQPQSRNQLQTEVSPDTEAKSMTGMRFKKLLAEFMKTVQAPSQPLEVQGSNLSVKDFGHKSGDDQPISIEPLQAVLPGHSFSLLKPLENFRTGKMTELLQAVHENMRENQASRTEQPDIGSGETEIGDKRNA